MPDGPPAEGGRALFQLVGCHRLAVESGYEKCMSSAIVADIGCILVLCMRVEQQFLPAVSVYIVHKPHPFADEKIAITDLFHTITAIGQIGNGTQLLTRIGEEDLLVRKDIKACFGCFETIGPVQVVHVQGRDVLIDTVDLAGFRIGHIDNPRTIDRDIIEPIRSVDRNLPDDMPLPMSMTTTL